MPLLSSILVVGSVNTDLVIRGERLPHAGETVLGGKFFQASGGKGANQAVAAARLSREPVTFIAAVGDDPLGREALANLRAENLNCDFVKSVSGAATGVALILVDRFGQNMISVASGANSQLCPSDIEAVPEELFRRARIVLTNLETPLETVERVLHRAKAMGLRTILNPAPVPNGGLPFELLPLVDVLTPNETEAASLLGATGGGEKETVASLVRDGALQLQARGCRAVIVTLGKEGCLIAEHEVTVLPAHQVTAIDTTAAGDAFNGALTVALAEGKPLVDAARWATVAAALSVTRCGAQPSLPTRDEVEAQAPPC